LLQGYRGLKAREALIQATRKRYVRDAAVRLVDLYKVWGKPDQAAEWAKLLETPKRP
jgi:outer membrane protein assembly factor BamD (BamD/ComL family)